MAYEDMPCGVYALPCPGTTIRPIVKPGALNLPLPSAARLFSCLRRWSRPVPNFAQTAFSEIRGFLGTLTGVLCQSAHIFPSAGSMMYPLRGQPMPREGAGRLPVLLLD
jgi:hypothetical protein